MRVLVVTRGAWRNDNNTGNTMMNLFQGMDSHEIYGLCFRSEEPKNNIARSNYTMSESQIILHFAQKGEIGQIAKKQHFEGNTLETDMYTMAKKSNFASLRFLRELLWIAAPWKNENLKKYLDYVKPEIVFMPVFGCWYPHRVLAFIKSYTKAKVILFHADDNYTNKQFAVSPIYWLYRLNLRKWIRKSVDSASFNYAISGIQKNEYEKIFKKKFNLLYKSYDFSGEMPESGRISSPLRLVFTGNVTSGRWKSLVLLGQALDRINGKEVKAQLIIYSASVLDKKMQKAFSECKSIVFKGRVEAEAVVRLQSDADVLVHAESFSLRDRLEVRMSFSTKIVDYLARAKCILAIGPPEVASIDYFIRNDAGIVITSPHDAESILKQLLAKPELVKEFAGKAWECGQRNHHKNCLQTQFLNDLKNVYYSGE